MIAIDTTRNRKVPVVCLETDSSENSIKSVEKKGLGVEKEEYHATGTVDEDLS